MAETTLEKKPYDYFDTPDGQDTFKKLWVVMKPTLAVAGGLSTADVLLITHPKGVLPTLGRYLSISFPVVAIASTFVLTTNTLANVRQKDDKLNWFLGGVATGSCFGFWTRKPNVGFTMAVAIGLSAVTYKYLNQQGWQLIPTDNKYKRGGATTPLADFSLIAERPRNWTTGK